MDRRFSVCHLQVVGRGQVPAPIKLGGGDQKRSAARWTEEDIQQWIEEKKNASNPE
jgi:predicted DNA-binding transcriptional regulator AlpA